MHIDFLGFAPMCVSYRKRGVDVRSAAPAPFLTHCVSVTYPRRAREEQRDRAGVVSVERHDAVAAV